MKELENKIQQQENEINQLIAIIDPPVISVITSNIYDSNVITSNY